MLKYLFLKNLWNIRTIICAHSSSWTLWLQPWTDFNNDTRWKDISCPRFAFHVIKDLSHCGLFLWTRFRIKSSLSCCWEQEIRVEKFSWGPTIYCIRINNASVCQHVDWLSPSKWLTMSEGMTQILCSEGQNGRWPPVGEPSCLSFILVLMLLYHFKAQQAQSEW